MFRTFVDLLTGRKPDPTRDWPTAAATAPEVDRARGRIGSLQFGATLSGARVFGKPDCFRQPHPERCELVYARAGFLLDFERERLSYAAFFVGPDSCVPNVDGLAFSQPVLDRKRLTAKTTVDEIEVVFGPPSTQDVDDDETVLIYTQGSLTLEFETTPEGLLKRVNLYPTDPAA